jgi:hypothetical protein
VTTAFDLLEGSNCDVEVEEHPTIPFLRSANEEPGSATALDFDKDAGPARPQQRAHANPIEQLRSHYVRRNA